MTPTTFDRDVISIHYAHEIVPGSPLFVAVEHASGALGGEAVEIVYEVEGGHIVQGSSQAVYVGDDGEIALTDIYEELSEDAVLLLGLAGSAVAGAVLSKIAVQAKRTVEKAIQLHRKGKTSAAEKALAKLGDRDRKQIEAIFAAETRRLKGAHPKPVLPSRGARQLRGVREDALDERGDAIHPHREGDSFHLFRDGHHEAHSQHHPGGTAIAGAVRDHQRKRPHLLRQPDEAEEPEDEEMLDELELGLDELECLVMEDMSDALQTAIAEHPEDVNKVGTRFAEFDEAVRCGDFEKAELLYETIVEVLPLDEFKRMTMASRTARLRSRRRGVTQQVKAGKKSRSVVRRENRLRRMARRRSPTQRMKEKRRTRKRRFFDAHRRNLSIAKESAVVDAEVEAALLEAIDIGDLSERAKEAVEIMRVSTFPRNPSYGVPTPQDAYSSFLFYDDGSIVRERYEEGRNHRTVLGRISGLRGKLDSIRKLVREKVVGDDPTSTFDINLRESLVERPLTLKGVLQGEREVELGRVVPWSTVRAGLLDEAGGRPKHYVFYQGKNVTRETAHTANVLTEVLARSEAEAIRKMKKSSDVLYPAHVEGAGSHLRRGTYSIVVYEEVDEREVREGTILQMTGPEGVQFRQFETDPDHHYKDRLLPKGVQDDPLPHDSVAQYREAQVARAEEENRFRPSPAAAANAERLRKLAADRKKLKAALARRKRKAKRPANEEERILDAIIDEVAPPGFEGTVKKLKADPSIDNPYALAWSMYKKGYKSHRKKSGAPKNEDTNVHGVEFDERTLLSMWEDEDEATRGTFEEWRARYFTVDEGALNEAGSKLVPGLVWKEEAGDSAMTGRIKRGKSVTIEIGEGGPILAMSSTSKPIPSSNLPKLKTAVKRAVSGIDWTRPMDELKADAKVRVVFDRVQALLARGAAESELDEHETQYKRLNDAAHYDDGYKKGSTEVWYQKNNMMQDFSMGLDFLRRKDPGKIPTKKTLDKTHKLIGKIAEKRPERVFGMMQGERWSPDGEARTMLSKLGIHHTSMSVGDIVKIGTRVLFVDRDGFTPLD